MSINKAIKELRALGWVHIAGWARPGGGNTLAPVYSWNGKKPPRDAPKPPSKPRTLINKDWYTRNKGYVIAMQRVKRGTKPSIWQGLIRG